MRRPVCKFCRHCGIFQHPSNFYRNPKTKDRLSTYCKTCSIKKYAEYMKRYPKQDRSNERTPLIDLKPEGPDRHVCGHPLIFGTNGFGYTVEWCGHCGTETMTPRGMEIGLRHA